VAFHSPAVNSGDGGAFYDLTQAARVFLDDPSRFI
jgi:hypothetical protein